MNAEEVKELIDSALATLRDAGIDPESPLGAAMMPEVLAALRDSARRQPAIESPDTRRDDPGPGTEDTSPFAKLSQWSGLPANLLEDVIESQGDSVILHVPGARLPRSKAGSQRMLAYAYLATMRQGFETADVPAEDLNELLKEYDVMDQNVWGNLEGEAGSFSRRGSRGAYTYRLTIPGLERARSVFVELLGAD